MKKLLKYANGSFYVVDGKLSIYPSDTPTEQWDISDLNDNEIEHVRKNGIKRFAKRVTKIEKE